MFASDLEDNFNKGDQAFADFTRAVDRYISATDMNAQPSEYPPQSARALGTMGEIDIASAGIGSVIWATGYDLDFSWVHLPIFDEAGEPLHRRGVTTAAGIYFLGLAWLYKMKSSFLYGVGEDAEYLAARIGRIHPLFF